jgi:hypothetical protein
MSATIKQVSLSRFMGIFITTGQLIKSNCISLMMKLFFLNRFICVCIFIKCGRDNVVGLATGYGLDDRKVGLRVPVESRMFSSPSPPARLWGSLNLLSMGTGSSFPGSKAAGA